MPKRLGFLSWRARVCAHNKACSATTTVVFELVVLLPEVLAYQHRQNYKSAEISLVSSVYPIGKPELYHSRVDKLF